MKQKFFDRTLIITCLLCLIPIPVYLFFYDQLPDPMPVHFGTDNVANGFLPKPVTVFVLPFLFVALNLICMAGIRYDPKNANASSKIKTLVFWLIPVLSIFVSGATLLYCLNIPVNIGMIVCLLVGFVFLIMGNYLPKCKQNYTVGIRLPWTLSSRENWDRTHRFSGWCFIIAGLVFLISAFLNFASIPFAPTILIAILLALVPGIYSFVLYKKGI